MRQYAYEIEVQVTFNKKITLDSTDADTAMDVALLYAESLYGKDAEYTVVRHLNLGDADEGRDYETVPY